MYGHAHLCVLTALGVEEESTHQADAVAMFATLKAFHFLPTRSLNRAATSQSRNLYFSPFISSSHFFCSSTSISLLTPSQSSLRYRPMVRQLQACFSPTLPFQKALITLTVLLLDVHCCGFICTVHVPCCHFAIQGSRTHQAVHTAFFPVFLPIQTGQIYETKFLCSHY